MTKRIPNRIIVQGETAYLELTNTVGEVAGLAAIDAADIPKARSLGLRWVMNGDGYVVASRRDNGRTVWYSLHRHLLDAPAGVMVDHRDRKPLNNRRRNLRLATRSLNGLNRRADRRSRCSVPGIAWHEGDKAWRVQIMVNGKRLHFGQYKDKDIAERVAKHARRAIEQLCGGRGFVFVGEDE